MGIFGGFGGDPNAIAVNDRNVQPGLAGLLRMPGVISGYGGGTFDLQGSQVTPVQNGDTQQAVNQYAAMPQQQAPEQPKGGFFSHGLGAVLANAFGGALDGAATHFGAPGGFAASQARQAEEAKFLQRLMMEAQQAAAGRREASDLAFANHQRERIFDNANPAPNKPGALQEKYDYLVSIGRKDLADSLITNEATAPPIVQRNENGTSTVYPSGMIPRMANTAGGDIDAQPVVEDGHSYTPGPGGRANPTNWKAVGGGVSNGTGGFR